jgi:hypothetical protein
MSDIWKPIVGYEGFYEVSDRGHIRSLDRYVKHWRGGNRLYPGRILEPHQERYLKVGLSKNGKSTTHRVHNLVMMAFVGAPPEGMEVCHNDGINYNCELRNLRYGTHLENIEDRAKHGKTTRGKDITQSVLSEKDITIIRNSYRKREVTQRELANRFGVSQHTVWAILQRRTWAWLNDNV